MRRRTFLGVVACAVGGAWVSSGCGEDGAEPTDPETHGLDGTPFTRDARFFPQSVASGDPTESTVVLWTRVQDGDAAAAGEDLQLTLEVARDASFREPLRLQGGRSLSVVAESAFDHCVKVRLEGLAPGTTLFYRFLVRSGGQLWSSRVGRTRTAPAVDDVAPVRFAFVSCQDFNGRYYHPYATLVESDPDFVLHLGDYVYETTNDPGFQTGTEDRQVAFDDTEGAIVFAEGEPGEYHAARTLEQYRTLYRITRSDKDLQAAHEALPFLCTWDDHEFSNDAWGAHGTYFAGRVDEEDVPRRKAANQAWFEYMPVDWPQGPDFRYDPAAEFPGDLIIYRDLRWGALAHLVLPDVRTWRTDHVIDEAGFPGRIVVTEEDWAARGESPPSLSDPYLDLDDPANASFRALVERGAAVLDYKPEHASGRVSVAWLDTLASTLDPDGEDPDVPRVDASAREGLPRGIAYHHMGKSAPYSGLGSRDLVVEEPFLRYATQRWLQSDGESEDMLGREQEAWFLETMRNSTARWKIWGNAVPLSNMAVDLRGVESAPPSLAQRFLMTVEDWAGMPNRRSAVLAALAEVENVLVCTGDRHAFLAGTPAPDSAPESAVVEFVTGGISSNSFGSIVMSRATQDPALLAAGAPALALLLRDFLLDRDDEANPHLAEALVREHGFVLVELTEEEASVTLHAWPDRHAREPERPDASTLRRLPFRVPSGSRAIERPTESGGWERWDPSTSSWRAVST